jgi:hypothetical protein
MNTHKQFTYKSETLGLPPLKMVLGDVPDPNPSGKRRTLRPFGENASWAEAKGTLTKLIGHLKDIEK